MQPAATTAEWEPNGLARWLRRAALVFTALFPLIVLPQRERPFSEPKIAALGLALVAGALLAARCGILRWPRLPAAFEAGLAAWLAALGFSACFGAYASLETLLLPVLAAAWFLLLVVIRPRAEHAVMALVVSGALVSSVAVLQFFGLDLFALLGWAASGGTGPRMRVYATLGNPNFVAAFLVALIPVTAAAWHIHRRARVLFAVALGLELLAVYATGSRAAALALGAVCLWIALLGKLPALRKVLFPALLAATLLPAFSPARPLRTTLEGRFYIWRLVAEHVSQVPLFGFGPGAFAAQYGRWETERWKAAPPPSSEAGFAGLQNHAHNDYLETLVDYGPAGLAGFLAVVISFLLFGYQKARRAHSETMTGLTAAVVALLAVALVDFPFRRPAEQFVFWTLLAIACLAEERPAAQESISGS